MRVVELIARKRDGHALSRDDIRLIVAGAADGTIPDYQLAALLMAIVLRGMDDEETAHLTAAMVDSGERLDFSDVPGVKAGKHSTGGVGDKVSIALVPLVAACGIVVPKMSGRGLGHTGGTIDKLESIPGYRTDLSIAQFKDVLRRVGGSIIGQTAALVPADRRLYALRDVTATVESIPLIAASVMSKKLAEGTSALLLDVKCGAGAFMKDLDQARGLARLMVETGARAGVRTRALVTRMDAPLGRAVGNALEIQECVRLLRGEGPDDLLQLVTTIAASMVALASGGSEESATLTVRRAIDTGEALDRMRRLIEAHGGEPRIVDEPRRLPQATHRVLVRADRTGYVTALHAERIGRAAVVLGAGRERVGEVVDHAAGITLSARPGDRVDAGAPLLVLHTSDPVRCPAAEALARSAVHIGEAPPDVRPLVLDRLEAHAAAS